jgi:hypothetical protein
LWARKWPKKIPREPNEALVSREYLIAIVPSL